MWIGSAVVVVLVVVLVVVIGGSSNGAQSVASQAVSALQQGDFTTLCNLVVPSAHAECQKQVVDQLQGVHLSFPGVTLGTVTTSGDTGSFTVNCSGSKYCKDFTNSTGLVQQNGRWYLSDQGLDYSGNSGNSGNTGSSSSGGSSSNTGSGNSSKSGGSGSSSNTGSSSSNTGNTGSSSSGGTSSNTGNTGSSVGNSG